MRFSGLRSASPENDAVGLFSRRSLGAQAPHDLAQLGALALVQFWQAGEADRPDIGAEQTERLLDHGDVGAVAVFRPQRLEAGDLASIVIGEVPTCTAGSEISIRVRTEDAAGNPVAALSAMEL